MTKQLYDPTHQCSSPSHLPKTVNKLLRWKAFAAGHADSSASVRTGYRDLQSLRHLAVGQGLQIAMTRIDKPRQAIDSSSGTYWGLMVDGCALRIDGDHDAEDGSLVKRLRESGGTSVSSTPGSHLTAATGVVFSEAGIEASPAAAGLAVRGTMADGVLAIGGFERWYSEYHCEHEPRKWREKLKREPIFTMLN